MAERYFEDCHVGQIFETGTFEVTRERMIEFAKEYDPQSFHMDDLAAKNFMYSAGIISSGWLTASITMRLLVHSELWADGGVVGIGADHIRWPRPVHAGNILKVTCEILEMRLTKSRPDKGFMKISCTTHNEEEMEVMHMVCNTLVQRRDIG